MLSLPPKRRHVGSVVAGLLVLSLLAPVAVSVLTHTPADLRAGTMDSSADSVTVVGIQGFDYFGESMTKKPARLLSIGAAGDLQWLADGREVDTRWFYDVDPIGEDGLLVSTARPEGTIVVRYDQQTGAVNWTETLPYHDTHDVDWLGDGELLVANMRQTDNETGVSNDRILVYDRHDDEVVWEWRFRDHYPNATAGGFDNDWTHVNDVDRVGEGLYLTSPRNFDQAIVVNRSTGDIELRLGGDESHEILNRQHNPDLLRGENGSVSLLVADSENDRIVEYARQCEGGEGIVESDPEDCEWTRTWLLEGGLNWPRDADRLSNGNTLVTDTLNHRIIEVTPSGRIVWEYYATWGPYDAERISRGDGSKGPPMVDIQGPTRASPANSAGLKPGTGDWGTFHGWLVETANGTVVEGPIETFAVRWAHITPWLTPRWMTGWDLAMTLVAAVALFGWGTGEAYLRRERIWTRVPVIGT